MGSTIDRPVWRDMGYLNNGASVLARNRKKKSGMVYIEFCCLAFVNSCRIFNLVRRGIWQTAKILFNRRVTLILPRAKSLGNIVFFKSSVLKKKRL
jgi:hypothetical protein